ncbi:type II secretion system F family protein [Nocardioides houyundeii]|uniref:type II secretion system F family protein n=1 Tax=Nocardioides houyundeii TaxID=2045452 RepID=UPI000DF2F4BD|nr:type II secretion system F family protein [Nocardioides houyundeii]
MTVALTVVSTAVSAGCAAALLLPPRPAVAGAESDGRRVPVASMVAVVAAALVLLAVWGPGGILVPAVLTAVGRGVLVLVRQRRARAAALSAADRVLEGCTVLADELAAGRTPESALELAARACPELTPAVRASRFGADVPAALRGAGHPDLRLVAAAWQVAHRSGEGLGEALAKVAAGLRAARSTRRVVASELASARATARLLVALPGLALLAGSGAGTAPWTFLLGTPVGGGCLVGGLGLAFLGTWWIEAIAEGVERHA